MTADRHNFGISLGHKKIDLTALLKTHNEIDLACDFLTLTIQDSLKPKTVPITKDLKVANKIK